MSKLLDFLTPGWIDTQLAQSHVPPPTTGNEADWKFPISRCMTRCELEHARGTDPSTIRGLCRELTESFAPVVASMDFSPKETVINGGMRRSSAIDLADRFGGRWWSAGQHYAGVRYRAINQPFRLEMPKVWMIAALAGDPDLACQVAHPYRVFEPHQLSAKFQVREIILRHALAQDHAAEQALADKLETGYMADFPPDLIEFPLGVIRKDPAMLTAAMKKTTTQFKGKWDPKRIRAWYDKQVELYGTSSSRSPGSWEDALGRTKHALFDHHYVIAWWALAWLNIARWRGIEGIPTNAFSDWIPQSLA